MRFRTGYGDDKILYRGSLKSGSDRIVPNSELETEADLADRWDEYQPIGDWMAMFPEATLAVGRYHNRYQFEFESILLTEDDWLAATTILEGHKLFFPTPGLEQQLRVEGKSLVRFKQTPDPYRGSVEIDTRDASASDNQLEFEFNREGLTTETQNRGTVTSHYVGAADTLAGLHEYRGDPHVVGTTDSPTPIGEFLQTQFDSTEVPIEQTGFKQAFCDDKSIIGVKRTDTEAGREFFITKTGYQQLAANGYALIRAERDTDDPTWSTLEIIHHPAVEVEP
jgi:hypothetical protein